MSSVVVTGAEFRIDPTAVFAQGPFKRIFLAEGDSWMDKSSALTPSLPVFLGRAFDQIGEKVLIINIGKGGDEMRRITKVLEGEFAWWLKQYKFDAILLSAGGNDFIAAAKEVPAGQGLLHNMAGKKMPINGYDCVSATSLHDLRRYLDSNFSALYDWVRADKLNARTPIFLNCYDTPTARDSPAPLGTGPWLFPAYNKNSIDPSVWPTLTEGLFKDIKSTIEGWATRPDGTGNQGVYAVPTTGVLKPASPNDDGKSGDWINEIHPRSSGWRKLAAVWSATLRTRLS